VFSHHNLYDSQCGHPSSPLFISIRDMQKVLQRRNQEQEILTGKGGKEGHGHMDSTKYCHSSDLGIPTTTTTTAIVIFMMITTRRHCQQTRNLFYGSMSKARRNWRILSLLKWTYHVPLSPGEQGGLHMTHLFLLCRHASHSSSQSVQRTLLPLLCQRK
jgi:hypothetical protein